MKTLLLTLLAIMICSAAFAGGTHYTRAHVTKHGTYVSAHTSSNANHTRNDNYSHKGNTNPYTGKTGTQRSSNSHATSVGPNGGSYYYNSKGGKTYVSH